MYIQKQIEELNALIVGSDESIKAYSLTEAVNVSGNTVLTEAVNGATVSINDQYNAVLWHRLISADASDYAGRGNTEQQLIKHRVKLLCYSKSLAFYEYLCAIISNNNKLSLNRLDFNKEALLKQELPEALNTFNNIHYFFLIEYTAKSVIDSKCLTNFCF